MSNLDNNLYLACNMGRKHRLNSDDSLLVPFCYSVCLGRFFPLPLVLGQSFPRRQRCIELCYLVDECTRPPLCRRSPCAGHRAVISFWVGDEFWPWLVWRFSIHCEKSTRSPDRHVGVSSGATAAAVFAIIVLESLGTTGQRALDAFFHHSRHHGIGH